MLRSGEWSVCFLAFCPLCLPFPFLFFSPPPLSLTHCIHLYLSGIDYYTHSNTTCTLSNRKVTYSPYALYRIKQRFNMMVPLATLITQFLDLRRVHNTTQGLHTLRCVRRCTMQRKLASSEIDVKNAMQRFSVQRFSVEP